jgi:hypothetical protein
MYTKQTDANHRVVTPKGTANLCVHLVGPHPILQHFLDQMTLPRIVRSCLGTPREGILDHAQTLSVLIHNIILSPAPLYRIAEWAKPIDPAALGLSEIEKKSINDDRIARSLDDLASARARSLFFRLALHIIKQFATPIASIMTPPQSLSTDSTRAPIETPKSPMESTRTTERT